MCRRYAMALVAYCPIKRAARQNVGCGDSVEPCRLPVSHVSAAKALKAGPMPFRTRQGTSKPAHELSFVGGSWLDLALGFLSLPRAHWLGQGRVGV